MTIGRVLLSLSILIALTVGCGRDDPNAEPTIVVTQTQGDGRNATVIGVNEFEYSIQLNTKTAPEGPMTFDLRNTGSLAHQFLLLKTDLPSDELPLAESTGQVNENSDELELIVKLPAYTHEEAPTFNLNVEPGHYALICNLQGHYARGMHIDFVVSPKTD